jgi:hypothetical protein
LQNKPPPKPKALETCTSIVHSIGELSKWPTRFLHNRNEHLPSTCLSDMQEHLGSPTWAQQQGHHQPNQLPCHYRYFTVAMGEHVPLESLQQHTFVNQDKGYTVPSTSASSALSVALVVPLFHPIFLAKQVMRTSQNAAPISTWGQTTGDRMIVDINISHLGPPPGRNHGPIVKIEERQAS